MEEEGPEVAAIAMSPSGSSSVVIAMREADRVMWRVVPPILLTLGTFGNLMTVVVMRGMQASQSNVSFFFYLIALAVTDQITLTSSLVKNWVNNTVTWPLSWYRYGILCFGPKFVWNASDTAAKWILVAMTYNRVISVVKPHRVQVLCSLVRGRIIVAVIVVLSCALVAQYLVTYKYIPVRHCRVPKHYKHIEETFEWLILIVSGVIPFLLLVIGNSVILRQIVKSATNKMRVTTEEGAKTGKRPVHSMILLLIVTSVVFLVLALPILIFGVTTQLRMHLITDEYTKQSRKLIFTIIRFLWFGSSSTNFYVYVLSGKKFRRETKKYFFCFKSDGSLKARSTPTYLPLTVTTHSLKPGRNSGQAGIPAQQNEPERFSGPSIDKPGQALPLKLLAEHLPDIHTGEGTCPQP